jgi:aconitate hydratase
MSVKSQDFVDHLTVSGETFSYFSLDKAKSQMGLESIDGLPISLKILMEGLLRHFDGSLEQLAEMKTFAEGKRPSEETFSYYPTRVLVQDFTGVPAIVDLAAMRDAMQTLGQDPLRINPQCPVHLVVDHSVNAEFYGNKEAFEANVASEYHQNRERYKLLKKPFDNLSVVSPKHGICHQFNLEWIAQVAWSDTKKDGSRWVYPDTLVGMDSHTTMINALAVLGWGVGGIEAEAAMLGQPIRLVMPKVIGFELTGTLVEGVTATDLVLTLTQMLREKGVVGAFVEFFGDGMTALSLAERATVSNMCPEFGSTCAFFPIDDETLNYLRLSGRSDQQVELVRAYAQAQGFWHGQHTLQFDEILTLDLGQVQPCVSGPKRPQDRVLLSDLPKATEACLIDQGIEKSSIQKAYPVKDSPHVMHHGDVVIAAITSCTNTSNPAVMIAAGLLAQKAVALGLRTKPWVKTSLAPGSKVVIDYLKKLDLIEPLEQLGFYLVGYGCTTCIGNSGPLPEWVDRTVDAHQLMVSSVLSGNRNFEGRIHPKTQANWLASPPLVVAYALLGNTLYDLTTSSLGETKEGKAILLKDIWPSTQEIQTAMACIDAEMFKAAYDGAFKGDAYWQELDVSDAPTYSWDEDSTYIRCPPFFKDMSLKTKPIENVTGGRILALLGDMITTDHISPAGSIAKDSAAADYLRSHQVALADFNSYGSRRGNHEVMMRGCFANIRIRNYMLQDQEGGFTYHYPSKKMMRIYDAAMAYVKENTPLFVFAGQAYGSGSSRDWAAKGPKLLGVKAVIAESFERIHRSNLIGMGILPCIFPEGISWSSLGLKGDETIELIGIDSMKKPRENLTLRILKGDVLDQEIAVQVCIDTPIELTYYRHDGILSYMIRHMIEVAD